MVFLLLILQLLSVKTTWAKAHDNSLERVTAIGTFEDTYRYLSEELNGDNPALPSLWSYYESQKKTQGESFAKIFDPWLDSEQEKIKASATYASLVHDLVKALVIFNAIHGFDGQVDMPPGRPGPPPIPYSTTPGMYSGSKK